MVIVVIPVILSYVKLDTLKDVDKLYEVGTPTLLIIYLDNWLIYSNPDIVSTSSPAT